MVIGNIYQLGMNTVINEKMDIACTLFDYSASIYLNTFSTAANLKAIIKQILQT